MRYLSNLTAKELEHQYFVPLVNSRIGINDETQTVAGQDVFKVDSANTLNGVNQISFWANKFDWESNRNTSDIVIIRAHANGRFRLAYKNEERLCKSLKTQRYL